MSNTDLIQNISDTAFWVSHYRAKETQRAKPLFQDPYAEILSGNKGKTIAENMPFSHFTEWVVTLRTVMIDTFIQDCIAAHNVDAILNLGAGLDARPYRMSLPSHVTWTEVDYPSVIAYKQEKLANYTPSVRLRQIGLDLADRDARVQLFQDLSGQYGRVLVLTEGVIPYLTNDDVAALAHDLFSQPSFAYWVVEYFTQAAIKRMKTRRLDKLKQAPFQFEPEDWHIFFEALQWKPTILKYFGEESERLNRKSPLPLIVKLLLKFMPKEKRAQMQRFAGFALLEKTVW